MPDLSKTSSNQQMSDSCCTFAPRPHSCPAFHVDSCHKVTHNAGTAMHSRLSTVLCLGRTPVVSLFTAVSRELTMVSNLKHSVGATDRAQGCRQASDGYTPKRITGSHVLRRTRTRTRLSSTVSSHHISPCNAVSNSIYERRA